MLYVYFVCPLKTKLLYVSHFIHPYNRLNTRVKNEYINKCKSWLPIPEF